MPDALAASHFLRRRSPSYPRPPQQVQRIIGHLSNHDRGFTWVTVVHYTIYIPVSVRACVRKYTLVHHILSRLACVDGGLSFTTRFTHLPWTNVQKSGYFSRKTRAFGFSVAKSCGSLHAPNGSGKLLSALRLVSFRRSPMNRLTRWKSLVRVQCRPYQKAPEILGFLRFLDCNLSLPVTFCVTNWVGYRGGKRRLRVSLSWSRLKQHRGREPHLSPVGDVRRG